MRTATSQMSREFADDPRAHELVARLCSGGDERLALDPQTGLNRYMSGPYPRDIVAYASSTANDISRDAFRHLLGQGRPASGDYGALLEGMRGRLPGAFGLGGDVDVVFAPSGTDLEYVALAATIERSPGGVHNVLLGADEVGRAGGEARRVCSRRSARAGSASTRSAGTRSGATCGRCTKATSTHTPKAYTLLAGVALPPFATSGAM